MQVEEINEMLKDAAEGIESPLAATYPEFWERLKEEVAEIKAKGGIVGGFEDI